MPSWSAKDPDAVKDYIYAIPLDPGDSITALNYTFTKLSGDVVVDNHSLNVTPYTDAEGVRRQDVTVWLSGGTDGETAVFRITWSTVGGRDDDDLITIAIVDDPEVLVYEGYVKPAPSHLVARYPAFADVSPDTIQIWLTDAERLVDTSWIEADYPVALMALAAHNMALAGLGATTSSSVLPAGATSLRSGSFAVTIAEEVAKAQAGFGYDATRYGVEFAVMLRRNKGGPRVTATGTIPTSPYRRSLLDGIA
jgi:hypothetical protein